MFHQAIRHSAHADHFDAHQNKLSATRELARAVLRDGGGFRCIEVSEAELSDLTDRAQYFLDTDGDDDGHFVALVEELDARLNPTGWGAPDNYHPDMGHGWWPSSQRVSWGMSW